MGLWGFSDGVWYRIKEYYHSGRESRQQLTDEEYYKKLTELAGDLPIRSVIIDVITSYSIHYTKLYEVEFRCFILRNGRFKYE